MDIKILKPTNLGDILQVNIYSLQETTEILSKFLNHAFLQIGKVWEDPVINLDGKAPFDNGWGKLQTKTATNNVYKLQKLSDFSQVKAEDYQEVYDSLLDAYTMNLRNNQQDKQKNKDILEKLENMSGIKSKIFILVVKLYGNVLEKPHIVHKIEIKCDGLNYINGNVKFNDFTKKDGKNAFDKIYSRGNKF